MELLRAWGIGGNHLICYFPSHEMGLGTLNDVREQQPYSWPFLNAIDTGRGSEGSYFASQCIRKQKKNQWKLGSELDQNRENSSNARTKTAPESRFENSLKFREN